MQPSELPLWERLMLKCERWEVDTKRYSRCDIVLTIVSRVLIVQRFLVIEELNYATLNYEHAMSEQDNVILQQNLLIQQSKISPVE